MARHGNTTDSHGIRSPGAAATIGHVRVVDEDGRGVPRDGVKTTEDELKLQLRDNLAHFKTPQWVSFVDDLPKTATGKVQKFVLRGGGPPIARQ